VIVRGANFFSGTKVVIGGVVLREEDGSLILKSSQALEFETGLASLTNGDAVLSGRFGSSFHLKIPADNRPVTSLFIERAQIKPFRYTKSFRITIDISGKDKNNDDVDLSLLELQKLPEAILFVGNEPVPMPYDYSNVDPLRPTGTGSPGDTPTTNKKFVRVAAWIPAKTLARSPSLAFRVPFCGIDYQASLPLVFSEPPLLEWERTETTRSFGLLQLYQFASGKLKVKVIRHTVDGFKYQNFRPVFRSYVTCEGPVFPPDGLKFLWSAQPDVFPQCRLKLVVYFAHFHLRDSKVISAVRR